MSFTLSPSQPDLLRHRRIPSSGDMLRSLFPSSSSGNSLTDFDDMSSENIVFFRRSLAAFVLFAIVFFTFNSLYSLYFLADTPFAYRSSPLSFLPFFGDDIYQGSEEYKLERVLSAAATKDKTVILTTLNEVWAMPDSIIDLFLESFRIGHKTRELLNHLVIIALDDKAFRRCVSLHRHCYGLLTEGMDFSKEAYFMTPDYLKMMWRRIDFLRSVLEMGYNFVFTDADVMWFRDPFPHFFPDADFQIACDHFLGDSFSVHNRPNGGFNYVKSNNRSIAFYKFWYSSQERYPGYHDQDVLNFIKRHPYISEIGLSMRFLDTTYFGGFCEPSKDLNKVCTMHANCCLGVNSKLHDLKILLQDWRRFMSLPLNMKYSQVYSWRVPENCSLDALNSANSPTSMESNAPDEEESES